MAIGRTGEEALFVVLDAARWRDGSAVKLRVEPAGNGQQRIANSFRLQPSRGVVMQQAIAGVAFARGVAHEAGLTKSLAEHEAANERLGRPTFAHELTPKPVEQFRIRGFVAESPEVIRRGDETGAEDPLPNAIDIHARAERMLRLQKRFREFETSAAGACGDGVLPAEHAEEVGLHERSGHIHIAAHIEGIAGLDGLPFVHAVHGARKGHVGFHEAILGHQRGAAR